LTLARGGCEDAGAGRRETDDDSGDRARGGGDVRRAPAHHTSFRLAHATTTIELELVEVADGSTSRQVSFSLLFRGPHQPPLAQQIHPFEHDRLGR
jgi:hypothetical protein